LQISLYLPLLKGKKVALVANQTSLVGETHLLDTLLALKINVVKVFAPEHGFRGDHSAGATVTNGKDAKTGVPLISLYGKNKKPSAESLKDVDVVVFDIQDVGVRFYTYISTMHYVMEACAENNRKLIVLDRPNPNGFYIDGPVLEPEYSTFVGMHPIPLVYGLTEGELAQMINGEGWLAKKVKCDLKVIPVKDYTHDSLYQLPVAPSPNLATMQAVYLYPTLGLFEGTDVSVGRGTAHPFEMVGKPGFTKGDTTFTPVSIAGKAEHPPYEGVECRGLMLAGFAEDFIKTSRELYIFWLEGFYHDAPNKGAFFNDFFDKLAGTDTLRKQIIAGTSIDDIRKSWQPGLEKYKEMRKKYLIYP
jgi:uncharacterized protein YbbC (DUF1343 family)